MADNSTVIRLINGGWYRDLEMARDIILNNPDLDPDGSLLADATAKMSASNPKDCSTIEEVLTKFDSYSLMTKIPKPQTVCSVWHIDQERYPTFFSYLQHLYPELRDIKVVLNKFNYDEAANLISRNLARKIAIANPENSTTKKKLEELDKKFEELEKERLNVDMSTYNNDIVSTHNERAPDIEDIRIRLERLEGNFDKFNKEFHDTVDKIMKAIRGEK